MKRSAAARVRGEGEPERVAESDILVLRLYITGGSRLSAGAVWNVSRLCEVHLRGRCDLQVIDLYQEPWLARDVQLVAAPTLVKERPLPERRFIGVMGDTARLLAELGVESPAAEKEEPRQ